MSIAPLGWILIALPALLLFTLTVGAQNPVPALAGFVLAGGIWWWLRSKDGATLGTLTGTMRLATKDLDGIEQAFTDKSEELLSITGTESNALREYAYRYHFVPDNVVTIERGTPSLGLFRIVAATVAVAFLSSLFDRIVLYNVVLPGLSRLFFSFSLDRPAVHILMAVIVVGAAVAARSGVLDIPKWDVPPFVTYVSLSFVVFTAGPLVMQLMSFGAPILPPILALAGILAKSLLTGLVLRVVLTKASGTLTIQLQGNQRKHFTMGADDARAVIDEFSKRSTTQTEPDGPVNSRE